MFASEYNKAVSLIDEKELVALTKKLISIPSYHGLEIPEKEISAYIFEHLKNEGIPVEQVPVEEERCNVIASFGNGADSEKTLMLEGHMDTVDVKNMKVDPFSGIVKDGKIYGRGSVDMKGALAAMITAILAVKKAGLELDGKVYFAGVVDEEFWFRGADHIAKNGPKTKYAIVGEPTGLEIHNGHRGLIWIEIKVTGKYAHGGTPDRGINAIEKMNPIVTAIIEELLPEIRKRTHPITGPALLNLGHIRGGTQPSTVAGDCILQFDRRWLPEESQEEAMQELDELLEKLMAKDPQLKAEAKVMDDGKGIDFPPLVCEESSHLVSSLKVASDQVIGKHRLSYFPAWTDGSILSRDGGIETVVFGPGHLTSAHSEEEFCPVSDLVSAAKVYLHTILNICK